MRYLGIDYGSKRTGLAISDPEGRLAVLKGSISLSSQPEVIDRIKQIIEEDQVESVVVGLPINMSGEPTEMTEHVNRFIEKLRNHVSVPVQTIDERLTTEMAKKLLQGVKNEDRDAVAAQIMLQNFLDEHSSH
ncbi:MAG: Holliday junction resolvase RuvX [Candidatus Kerfeldbacteria bacterium]|nr:Holliday junction resolvase RuvX [Candidatus Kerfeldbacteria bacterium]